jgi:hypothetical protein
MKKPKKDSAREERIHNEAIVDAWPFRPTLTVARSRWHG